MKTESKQAYTPGPSDILESAIDWMCDAEKNTDQWERGQELKKLRHLIKAESTMLNALHQALVWIGSDEATHGRNFGTGNVIRAAIAKAEGRA